MPSNLTLEFTIELDYFNKQAAREKARSSGRTSIRVSKSTLAALRLLAASVRTAAIAPQRAGDPYRSTWRTPAPPPDQLLAAIAGGTVHSAKRGLPRVLSPATLRKIKRSTKKKRHASKRSAKGMRRRPAKRRKVRA